MILPSEDAAGPADSGMKFPPGQIVATTAALTALTQSDIQSGLGRHLSGDWGDVCAEDKEENERSLKDGCRLLSAYSGANGTKFWIITEWDRSYTTVLLPSDY